MVRLREVLNDPKLARLSHHEPPGGTPLNIMGSVLELLISRASGVQELVLTDSKHRSTFFYPGDGDISMAEPLLKFASETMQPEAVAATSASELSGCSSLP
jgi:hypothetical protein